MKTVLPILLIFFQVFSVNLDVKFQVSGKELRLPKCRFMYFNC